MSRKCPKKNHLFLSWLKGNNSQFPLVPCVIRIKKRRIDFSFVGLISTMRFCAESTVSGGPWISVDNVLQGKERNGVARFYGAEILTDKGWTSLQYLPDNCYYFQSRYELWKELCFEQFLKWCKDNLTACSK